MPSTSWIDLFFTGPIKSPILSSLPSLRRLFQVLPLSLETSTTPHQLPGVGPTFRRAKAAHSSTGTKSDFNRDILSPLVQSHWLFQSMQSTHPKPDVIHEYPHKYASLEYQQTKQLLTHWGFRLWLKHGIEESAGSSRSKLNWLRLTCPVLHGQRWKLNRHNPHCGIKECGDNFHFKRLLSQASYSGRLRHSGKKGL